MEDYLFLTILKPLWFTEREKVTLYPSEKFQELYGLSRIRDIPSVTGAKTFKSYLTAKLYVVR